MTSSPDSSSHGSCCDNRTITTPAASYVLDSVDDLRDMSTTVVQTKEVAQTLGYYTPGDGGGQFFYWSPTSASTDNLGSILRPDDRTTGRWVALLQGPPVYNAATFGMGASRSASENTIALQSACDTGGDVNAEVVMPPGDLAIQTVNITKSIKLTGAGTPLDSGTKLFTQQNAPILNITARCTLEGFALEGSNDPAATSQDLIRATGVNNLTLRYLHVNIGYNNIRLTDVFFTELTGIVFDDSVNASLKTDGSTGPGNELRLFGCRVEGGDRTTQYVFLFDNLGTLTDIGTQMTHSGVVIAAVKVNTVATQFGGIILVGCVYEATSPSTGPSLWLKGTASYPVFDVDINGCYFGGSNVVGDPVIVLGYVHNLRHRGGLVYGINGSRGIRFANSVTKSSFIQVGYNGGSYQFIADEDGTVLDKLAFENCTADTTSTPTFYLNSASGLSLGDITIKNCDMGDTSGMTGGQNGGNIDRPTWESGKAVKIDCPGYHKGKLTAPSVPSTGAAARNYQDVPVTVYVNGSIDNVAVNNQTTNSAQKTIRVPVNGIVAMDYSSTAPTWTWFGE